MSLPLLDALSPGQTWAFWIYVGIIAIWPIRLIVVEFALRRGDSLGPDSPRFTQPDPPLVTAIIPAKDEESTIGECLTTVRAQDYPNLEILVVDDRSRDRTPEIVRAQAAEDPRVRLVQIHDLPPGWTGKTHALYVASADAKGSWLWFVDSDTRHEPSSLSIVLEYARRHGAALASLLPEMRCESFWEKVVQPLAGIVLLQTYPLFLVNNPKYKLAFANGQYILIRRDAYDAVGGHESVRDRFVEDIYLAREVKSRGLPIRVAIAQGIGSTRMYTSLPTLIRGWSRILYDANHRSALALVSKIFDQLIFNQSAHIALLCSLVMLLMGVSGPFSWLILSLSLIHHIWIYIVFRRLYHASIPQSREIWLYPLAGLVIDWILLKGIWSCWTGRVQWRGTAYK